MESDDPFRSQPKQSRKRRRESPLMSQVVVSAVDESRCFTVPEIDHLRHYYETLIGAPDWKAKLIQTAREITPDLATSEVSYRISLTGDEPVFLKGAYLSIGRKDGCELVLPSFDDSVSRLHLILFPREEDLVVVDLASMNGTFTLKRSAEGKELEHSPARFRQPLVFGREEHFTLKVGHGTILDFCPTSIIKECVICMEKPRDALLQCEHNCMCWDCFDILQDRDPEEQLCPLCRAPLALQARAPGIATCPDHC